eukprot:Rhum_TRINITY_DN21579_c0_g1::Rhum_TRINITY_DN21579_c0_g1_i1::g.174317::m.174317
MKTSAALLALLAGCTTAASDKSFGNLVKTNKLGMCDPAGSWLSYAVFKNPGKPITFVNVTWTVPSYPASRNSPAAPGWWYGVEPEPACDLIQPILAYGYTGNEYSIFNGEYDWEGTGWWASGTQTVQPGDKVYSRLTMEKPGQYKMVIGKVGGGDPIVSTRQGTINKPYSDLYFVVEHQPSSCTQYPASGTISFENINVEVAHEPVVPKWEQVKYQDACNCTGQTIDPRTLKFTWDTN